MAPRMVVCGKDTLGWTMGGHATFTKKKQHHPCGSRRDHDE
jgi:hypothetical protein